MHPADAAKLGITSGDLIELENNVGRVRAMAYVTTAVKRGHTFMLFGQPRGAVGALTSDHVDPSTTIPYYKGVWASVRRIAPQPDMVKRLSFRPQNVAQ